MALLNKIIFGKNKFSQILMRSFESRPDEALAMSHSFYGDIGTAIQHVPPVIVLHGLFGSKRTLRTICKKLTSETHPHRIMVAVDVRNHGNSPQSDYHSYPLIVEDIRLFMSEHKIEKTAFLGHSMGGRAVMYFSLKYPKLVEKLIVADISPINKPSREINHLKDIALVMGSVQLPKSGITLLEAKAIVEKALKEYFPNKAARDFFLTNLVVNSDGSFRWLINIPSLVKNIDNIINFPPVNNLQFGGPTLFIKGGDSDYIDKKDYGDILRIFPKADFTEIPHAGHWLHADNPEMFNHMCASFLNKN